MRLQEKYGAIFEKLRDRGAAPTYLNYKVTQRHADNLMFTLNA